MSTSPSTAGTSPAAAGTSTAAVNTPRLAAAINQLGQLSGFGDLAELAPGSQISASQNVRPYFCAALAEHLAGEPVLAVVPTNADAQRLAEDLRVWLGDQAVLEFPAWETLPFERVSPDTLTMGRRMQVMVRLSQLNSAVPATGQATEQPTNPPGNHPFVIVATVRALLQCLGPDATTPDGETPDGATPGGFSPPHLIIRQGDDLDPTKLIEQLVAFGYRREYQVEHRGEVAVRGGIIDVFGATDDLPIRIDLWGDEVERITEFDIGNQRSITVLDSVQICPARELRPDEDIRQRARELIDSEPWGREHWQRIADGELFDGMESWLPWLVSEQKVLPDLLPPQAQVVLIEPSRLRDRAIDIANETAELTETLAQTWGALSTTTAPPTAPPTAVGTDTDTTGTGTTGTGTTGTVAADTFEFPLLHVKFERLMNQCRAKHLSIDSAVIPASGTASPTSGTASPVAPVELALEASAWESVTGDSSRLLTQLRNLVGDTKPINTVLIAAENETSARNITKSLGDEDIPLQLDLPSGETNHPATPGLGHVLVAPFNYSFIAPQVGLAVLTEADLTGRRQTHRVARRRSRAQASFEDLNPGDFVVHYLHGIARFAGLVHRSFRDSARDYLELRFRGTDRLYLPTDQLELIRPYIGGDSPTVSRMGGAEFQKQKDRVRSEVNEIAQELVVLYQTRLATAGHRFDDESPWLAELADSFAYVPTPDQQKAIDEVLADMASDSPMDRLVCGDVGFGKTEIAVRAAMCSVTSGKQVAVLVPTTLLAQQHHQTFTDRLSTHAVRVEVLSRFLTAAQQKAVVKGLADGTVDVVIGTHRLLSADVAFDDLGLLVIDEEQRFGVKHKEAMKHLKASVDVLTLTATPIPRTLELSLTGIRDLSLLQTPPQERRPILTHVGPYDERAVSEAIRRELLREGQVFFVHNRVADIDNTAQELRQLVPEARIAVAHGQMDEGTLESVVIDFWEGEYDVLVCTTIIESGIDMPSVNTLVVDRADLLGLGQLHQIRGRVGRSPQRAYAYLFYPEHKVLTETAYERMRTIGEATQLGSGYRIAMRDLQLRGAGNLLSGVQSGHISAVGYDLYCELVSEAFAQLRGEPETKEPEIAIELPLKAYLPDEYVPRSDQRLEAYRRLGQVSELVEVADLEAEWLDRYGPIPAAAQTLLHIGLLRTECVRLGFHSVIFAASARLSGAGLSGANAASGSSRGSVGRLVLSPLKLSGAEQVRLVRIAQRHGFGSPKYKEASGYNSNGYNSNDYNSNDYNSNGEADQLQLGVEKMDSSVPGRIFNLLQELLPPKPAA